MAAWGGSGRTDGEFSLQVLAIDSIAAFNQVLPLSMPKTVALGWLKGEGGERSVLGESAVCAALQQLRPVTLETVRPRRRVYTSVSGMDTCRLEGAGRNSCYCRTFPYMTPEPNGFLPFLKRIAKTACRESPCCPESKPITVEKPLQLPQSRGMRAGATAIEDDCRELCRHWSPKSPLTGRHSFPGGFLTLTYSGQFS